MSCFFYAHSCPSTFADPTPHPHPHPHPHPNPDPALCPGFSFEFPAVERDYMGIGLGLKQEIVKEKASASSTSCSAKNSDIPSSADDLCGSHLKLAPPSSSADDGGVADDDDPFSGNVGWPPISSYRKATTRSLSIKTPCHTRDTIETPLLVYPQAPLIGDDDNHEYNASQHDLGNDASSSVVIKPSPNKPRKALHIKVSMDGTPIMRKLDLESMQGYQHLSRELHKLFKFYKSNLSCEVAVHSSFKESGDANFILTHKDKDGAWMLVGDTPWETFSRTARRLRIMKKAK